MITQKCKEKYTQSVGVFDRKRHVAKLKHLSLTCAGQNEQIVCYHPRMRLW